MRLISKVPDDLGSIANNGLAIGVGQFSTGNVDVFTNYPTEWQSAYDANGWISDDPVVRAGATTTGCFDWPELDPRTSDFASAAMDSGLHSGLLVANEIGGNRCIAGLACDKPLSAAARAHAETVVRNFHLETLTERASNLRPAQKELVYLFANGFRAKEVANLFDISEDTIKQRKQLIQRQIGVNNFLVVVNICARAGITFHPIN